MRLLLDSNIIIVLTWRLVGDLSPPLRAAVRSSGNAMFASAASLWEIAIKTRLGKLHPGLPLEELPRYLMEAGIGLVAIDHRHAIADVFPVPATRDPFDRMLLAQCVVEDMRLLTTDRALAGHPLAWRPG